MLVSSIFSFSHNVSTLSKSIFNFFVAFILSSANAFNLDQSENLLCGKELILYHSISNFNISFEIIAGKGENVGNQHFLLFFQDFLPYHNKEIDGTVYKKYCKSCKMKIYQCLANHDLHVFTRNL